MTKVTVAMASYNHAPFVGEAIESVLSQDISSLDFIIVDDGSQDATVSEIKKFKDSRIKFFSSEKNKGACIALRKAIEEGKGEYVSILNSDDCFLPNKLKKQIQFLDDHPEIGAVFGLPQFIDSQSNSIEQPSLKKVFIKDKKSRYEWLNHFFYKSNCLCHPTVLIRRSCYQKIGYYHPALAQIPDFDFWVRFSLQFSLHVLSEPLIKFRIHPHNMSAERPENRRRLLWEMTHVLKHYLNIPSMEEYLKIFPQEREKNLPQDSDLIQFHLAQLALSAPVPLTAPYSLFGIETLFNLFNHPSVSMKMEQFMNFTFAKFIETSAKHKIFDETYDPYEPPFFEMRLKKFGLKLLKLKS